MGTAHSARWAIALALGLRQGEALGPRWADVDLDIGTLNVRRSRLRPRWKHGCAEPCGRKFGGHCPQRVPLRSETSGTKVPGSRLHDARHTAATVLLLLGVPDRTVMDIMGWSNTAMAARYQHITSAIRRDVAQRVGGLLWKPADAPDEPDDDEGAAGVPIPT